MYPDKDSRGGGFLILILHYILDYSRGMVPGLFPSYPSFELQRHRNIGHVRRREWGAEEVLWADDEMEVDLHAHAQWGCGEDGKVEDSVVEGWMGKGHNVSWAHDIERGVDDGQVDTEDTG